MYYIFIDNKKNQSTESMQIAFANYRALCRDFKNKQSKIVLMLNDDILHAKEAGLMLLDDVDETTANQLLVLLMKKLEISLKEIKQIINKSELDISKSRIDGWFRSKSNRKHVKMYNDELFVVIEKIFVWLAESKQHELGYTPENLKKIIIESGLSQPAFAKKYGYSWNTFRKWVLPLSSLYRNDMSYEKWLDLMKKIGK